MTATLFHCHRVLETLAKVPNATLEQLCASTQGNSGHVAVMLRTLSTLGWVTRSDDGTYCTTRSVAICSASPMLAALCVDVYGDSPGSDRRDVAWGDRLPRLAK